MPKGKPFQVPNRKLLGGSMMLGFALILFWAGPLGRSRSVAGKSGEVIAENESLVRAPDATWTFAVSGDSRNCGDVVMPEIATGAQAHHAAFYWHLGDFRWGSDIDQDMAHEAAYREHPMSISRYESSDWNDFIQNQLLPFGHMPVFLAIGNHELHFKTEEDYLVKFATWLNAPVIRSQRLKDDPTDYGLHTYYHWIVGGVDFIALDNAAADQFNTRQMRWFESVLKSDEADPSIHTIVLGIHRALPHSLAQHSMDESDMGIESGTRAYKELLHAQQEAHKRVYVLCAHADLYLANIFNTDYWRSHGGVPPG